jgi:hypothetical protein
VLDGSFNIVEVAQGVASGIDAGLCPSYWMTVFVFEDDAELYPNLSSY